jgi:DNA-directed RNA polymerase sigma subunit (sigma70/sigma32)
MRTHDRKSDRRVTKPAKGSKKSLEQVRVARARLRAARAAYLVAIRSARQQGHSLGEIGQAIGVSRQRVHQLLSERADIRVPD